MMLKINNDEQQRLPFRVLDLFAGAGGLSLGFEKFNIIAGQEIFKFVGAVEWDKYACETLRQNHPGLVGDEQTTRIIEGDITDDLIHAKVINNIGKDGVDIIVGGPPCQSFSLIGTRSGRWIGEDGNCKNDKRDLLFEEYIRLVEQLKPLFVVLENVDGIRSKKDENGIPYLTRIINELEERGYNFNIENRKEKYLRLNAADYGVPQIRKRIFIVGSRIPGFKLSPPPPTHYDPEYYSNDNTPDGRIKWITLYDAIKDLPEVFAHYTRSNVSQLRGQELIEENTRRHNGHDEIPYHKSNYLKHHSTLDPQGKEFLNFVDGVHNEILYYHKARCQQESDIKLFKQMPAGATAHSIFEGATAQPELQELIRYDMKSFKDKYRKQHWDKPGTTIFAHLERDGNRFIHPDDKQARTFTVREAARVQSFPDNYIFAGSMNKRFRQIGNAVPPLLARAVASSIYESLKKNKILYNDGLLILPDENE